MAEAGTGPVPVVQARPTAAFRAVVAAQAKAVLRVQDAVGAGGATLRGAVAEAVETPRPRIAARPFPPTGRCTTGVELAEGPRQLARLGGLRAPVCPSAPLRRRAVPPVPVTAGRVVPGQTPHEGRPCADTPQGCTRKATGRCRPRLAVPTPLVGPRRVNAARLLPGATMTRRRLAPGIESQLPCRTVPTRQVKRAVAGAKGAHAKGVALLPTRRTPFPALQLRVVKRARGDVTARATPLPRVAGAAFAAQDVPEVPPVHAGATFLPA